jgi:hypothetical protein
MCEFFLFVLSVSDLNQIALLWQCFQCVRYQTASIQHTFIAGTITQSLQLQAQGMLASLGWCHKSRQCAELCARWSVWLCRYSSDYVETAVMWLWHEGRKVCEMKVVQNDGDFVDVILLYLGRHTKSTNVYSQSRCNTLQIATYSHTYKQVNYTWHGIMNDKSARVISYRTNQRLYTARGITFITTNTFNNTGNVRTLHIP